jgi:PLAT/LH2 domain
MRRVAHGVMGMMAVVIAIVLGTSTAQAAPASYLIDARTCDIAGAGTDANVQLKLSGSLAESSWLVLDNPGDDRERGQTDHYSFVLSDVGSISSVRLAYDHTGSRPDWCLEEVIVFGPHGTTVHAFHNWLTTATEFNISAA